MGLFSTVKKAVVKRGAKQARKGKSGLAVKVFAGVGRKAKSTSKHR